jgi:Flp pilus assembly protein TadG
MPGRNIMNLLTGLRKHGKDFMNELNPVSPTNGTRIETRSIAALLRSRLRPAEEGGALVEIALVLPILATLVLGIFSVGVMFMNYLDLTEATGAGAQYLQLIRTSTSDPCGDTFTAIKNAAPGLVSASVNLNFTLNGTPVSGTSCPGDQSDLEAGQPVSVTATYPCNLSIYGVNFAPSGCTLSATATEYEY